MSTAAIEALEAALAQNNEAADWAKKDITRCEEELMRRNGDLVRYSARNAELTAALNALRG